MVNNNMKKFMLFAGELCYPQGGFKDFIGTFNSLNEIQILTTNNNEKCSYYDEFKIIYNSSTLICQWYQIIDTSIMTIIKRK